MTVSQQNGNVIYYGVLTVSKNKNINIIIVKIILVQPICTQKLLELGSHAELS